MSHPPIYIELRGTTSDVRPRYIRPRPCRARDPRSPSTRCGSPDLLYAIRNSEVGNRKSGFGKAAKYGAVCRISRLAPVTIGPDAVQRIPHGAVFSLLTLVDMVR